MACAARRLADGGEARARAGADRPRHVGGLQRSVARPGHRAYRGSLAYFAEINAQGGVSGRPIVVKTYDDGYNPAPAIYNTITRDRERTTRSCCSQLRRHADGDAGAAAAQALRAADPSTCSFRSPARSRSASRPTTAKVFNLRASYRDETYALVDHFAAIGRKKIAILYQADAYGRSGWDGVRRALTAHKLTLAAEATYARGTPYSTHLTEQVEILRAAEPDAIIAIGAYAACAAFVRDAVERRLEGSDRQRLVRRQREHAEPARGRRRRSTRRDYTSMLVNSQVVPSYEDLTLPAVVEYRTLMQRHAPKAPAVANLTDYTLLGFNFAGFEGFLNAKVIVEVLRRMKGDLDPARIKPVVESIHDLDVGIDAPISFGARSPPGAAVRLLRRRRARALGAGRRTGSGGRSETIRVCSRRS